jgi:hypothetical protein
MLVRYCLSDSEMVPVTAVITGITFALIFHMFWIYYKVFIFLILLSFFLDHISVSRNCNIYWHACSLFVTTDYNVQFIVRNSSVSSHLLVP